MATDSPPATATELILDSPHLIAGHELRSLLATGGRLRRVDLSGSTTESPFDPGPSYRLFMGVLQNQTQSDGSPDGIHHAYHWADNHALDQLQLDLQWEDHWGTAYRHWHKQVFIPSRCPDSMPKTILVVGVPSNVAQVSFLLEAYPSARILGVELNPKNQAAAMATLARTRPMDVESGRIEIRADDAIELVPTLAPHSFDLVETDKVASHCTPAARRALYEAIVRVLVRGGTYHLSDILGLSWQVRVASGYEHDQRALTGVAVFREGISLVFKAFTHRGNVLWGDVEDLATETLDHTHDLGLIPSLSSEYVSPWVGLGTRGDYLGRFFIVMPYAGVQAARSRQDTPALQEQSRQMHSLALRMIGALEAGGVSIALPNYAHLALTLPQ